MKNLIVIVLLIFSSNAYAAGLSASEASLIKAAGVPIYSKASFVYGNQDVGFRFATSDSPENTKQWYIKELPEWSLLDKYGSWILYNGEPDLNLGDVMTKNQIMIQKNDNLPEWHSLDKSMTTEIVIMVVK